MFKDKIRSVLPLVNSHIKEGIQAEKFTQLPSAH